MEGSIVGIEVGPEGLTVGTAVGPGVKGSKLVS